MASPPGQSGPRGDLGGVAQARAGLPTQAPGHVGTEKQLGQSRGDGGRTLMMLWQVASGSPTRLVPLTEVIWSPMLSFPERAAGPPFIMLARITVGRMEPQPDSTTTTPRISPLCFSSCSCREVAGGRRPDPHPAPQPSRGPGAQTSRPASTPRPELGSSVPAPCARCPPSPRRPEGCSWTPGHKPGPRPLLSSRKHLLLSVASRVTLSESRRPFAQQAARSLGHSTSGQLTPLTSSLALSTSVTHLLGHSFLPSSDRVRTTQHSSARPLSLGAEAVP